MVARYFGRACARVPNSLQPSGSISRHILHCFRCDASSPKSLSMRVCTEIRSPGVEAGSRRILSYLDTAIDNRSHRFDALDSNNLCRARVKYLAAVLAEIVPYCKRNAVLISPNVNPWQTSSQVRLTRTFRAAEVGFMRNCADSSYQARVLLCGKGLKTLNQFWRESERSTPQHSCGWGD